MKTELDYLPKKKWSGRLLRLTVLLMLAGIFGLSNPIQAQSWDQLKKVVPTDRSQGDVFGHSVSISGNYAIVGAEQDDTDPSNSNPVGTAGSAYIFEHDGSNNWLEKKIVASDRGRQDHFGYSVSISGNYAIVGAYMEDEDASGNDSLTSAGSAYIFERNSSGIWLEVQKIVASDRDSNDNFAYSVCISGDYAIVGAYQDDEDANGADSLADAGSAYIYERDVNGDWQEVCKIVASDRAAADHFGRSVAISGNYVVVGARYEDEDIRGRNTKSNAGSAYIFERDGNGFWQEVKKLVASDRAVGDLFGYSVSISGNAVLVGALQASYTGAAYIFERSSNGKWNQTKKLLASDAAGSDYFGWSVSISGNHAVVSARAEDHDATGGNYLSTAGSAYVFEKDGSGNWQEVEKIVASDRELNDCFGWSASISGNYAIVGARYEAHDEFGGNYQIYAGSAYVYNRTDPCAQSTLAADAGSDQFTYYGYTPTECATLTGSATGGAGSYSYSWDGVSSQTINVCPSSTSVYNLTVSDANGCTATDDVTVYVTDVRCQGKKVLVCFNGTTLCIKESEVASHLAQGAVLGACASARMASDGSESELKAYPNPTNDMLYVDFLGIEDIESIALLNTGGLKIHDVEVPDSRRLTLDVRSLPVGVYILCVKHYDGKLHYKKVVIFR